MLIKTSVLCAVFRLLKENLELRYLSLEIVITEGLCYIYSQELANDIILTIEFQLIDWRN